MSKHWATYRRGGATQKQVDYLDRLANDLNIALGEGRAAGVDVAKWGEQSNGAAILDWAGIKGAPTSADASRAIDFAKAKLDARREKIAAAQPSREMLQAKIAALRADLAAAEAQLAGMA